MYTKEYVVRVERGLQTFENSFDGYDVHVKILNDVTCLKSLTSNGIYCKTFMISFLYCGF